MKLTANQWIKKVHTYLGLVNLTILLIFGIVGLSASFLKPPSERERAEPEVRNIDYVAPGDLSDRALVDHAFEALDIPLTQPAPDWSIHRDDQNYLGFRLPTPAKRHDIVVFENESRLQVTTTTLDIWDALFRMHELTLNHAAPDWRTQLWALYIEVSIWSLILMVASGILLWLTSRPKLRWAQLSFAAGIISFIALWAFSR